ncbi:MAG: chorismate lyase [Proteobacteria bacterium]|nr:chorismate lyase [Pseudomonadota bacterium]
MPDTEPIHAARPSLIGRRVSIRSVSTASQKMGSWHARTPTVDNSYAPWLRTGESLTLRIQQRCGSFSVRNIRSHLAIATHDETALLGLPSQQKIYTREVLLYADDKPVVYAHSVVAPLHLSGAWHALRRLGNRSLGTLLFSHPLVRRSAPHFCTLRPSHPLHRRAAIVLNTRPERLWARRSLFFLRNAPLLVTEIFLPDILTLQR